jgi:hypothetical protein
MATEGWLIDRLMELLPPYTEQWATTYLQILFQSFLFALGVPAAMYGLIVDTDIKRVTYSRVWARRYLLVTLVLYAAASVIVWFIHPERGMIPSIFKSIFAASTVTLLPIGVFSMGLWLNTQFKREKVVEHLAGRLLQRPENDSSINSDALRDLSYLGEHGRSGKEKDIVLKIIDGVAKRAQEMARRFDYKGYELDSLIRQLPVMLDNTGQPGNDENYLRTADLLKDIWRWLSTRGVTGDALATKAAIRQLALRSVKTMAEDTTFRYLDVAADCDSNIVFEMGLAAIKVGKYRVAAGALDKLEMMAGVAAGDHGPGLAHRAVKGNLLGIVACMAAEGSAGAMRAETTLRLNEELFSPSLRLAINDAFDYHYRAGRFDIADKVRQLSAEAEKMKTVDLDRNIP